SAHAVPFHFGQPRNPFHGRFADGADDVFFLIDGPVRDASPNRTLDVSHLALRFDHRGGGFRVPQGVCLLDPVLIRTATVWWCTQRLYAESEIHGRDGIGRKGGGEIVEGAVSCSAGDGDFLQGLAAGSGAADVDEQSGPGSGREAAGADCLRRNGTGGEKLGMLSRYRAVAARAGGRRTPPGAIREAGGNFSHA